MPNDPIRRKRLEAWLVMEWSAPNTPEEELDCLERLIDAEITILLPLMELVREIEEHCPCGARPESLDTHPHVGGCPVAQLAAILSPIARESREKFATRNADSLRRRGEDLSRAEGDVRSGGPSSDKIFP